LRARESGAVAGMPPASKSSKSSSKRCEVALPERGFQGSWYTATRLRTILAKRERATLARAAHLMPLTLMASSSLALNL